MLIILLLCVSFCCAGNVGLSANRLTNLISKNGLPTPRSAPIPPIVMRRQSAPIIQILNGLPTHRSAPIPSMVVRRHSAPIIQSLKEKILKTENNNRKQTFVAKVKSSEFVQEQLDNENKQQFKFSFMEYWTTVNVSLGYKGASYEYLGRYVAPKVTANIALNMLNALQHYLYELIEVSFDVPKVLTPEHFVFIREAGDQFSQDELIGNIRVEFDSNVPRVEDPRQRALSSDQQQQQSKIIWGKDFIYMSPQQIKNSTNVSGEKDIVWSMGIILYEMIYGYNPFGDPKRTIQPKQQWHWIPLNDEKGEMKEVFKQIEDEQEYINFKRRATLNSLDKNYQMLAFGGPEEFNSLLGECLQNNPEKRISLNELSKRLEQIKKKLPNDKAVFKDRQDAGQKLAKVLAYLDQLKKDELVVLALPRGGVPVAYEIAKSLKVPLDLLFAKRIGFPGNDEFGIGAVAEGNPPHLVTNAKAMQILKLSSTDQYIHEQMEVKLKEIERQRKKYLANRPPIPLEGRAVIVVDDGMATGVTALAVLQKLREAKVAVAILASPVCSLDTLNHLQDNGYELVCLETPRYFTTVSQNYEHFDQISDEEVIRCLDNAKVWMGKSGDE
uniref:Protein kinase domain-containing protein n=1 Tax=Globodera rostochiensis TaxID=31243 RepID=A0A914H5N9_GLORO